MDSHRWRAAGDFLERRAKEVDTVKVCDCRARGRICSGDTLTMVCIGLFWVIAIAGFVRLLRRCCCRGGAER